MFATISEALLALPVGADAIAEHLIELGVKAKCAEPSKCAIAEYLTRTTGLPVSVGVSDAEAVTAEGDTFAGAEQVFFTAISRRDVGEFISKFDRHVYPALIAEPVAA